MTWALVGGGAWAALCGLAVALSMSAAGRAAGSASAAHAAERGARTFAFNAQISSDVARSVTGVGFSFDQVHASTVDVSERIRQDLRMGSATAQRIDTRINARRRTPPTVPDVFVKPTT